MNKKNNNDVQPVAVLDEKTGNTLFAEDGVSYEIPIYQRAFAWGTGMSRDVNRVDEVCQLMDDVCNSQEQTYYIGSMVVWEKKDVPGTGRLYEVIDGQQRLTALYVILKCLNWQIEKKELKAGFARLAFGWSLKYCNRPRSQAAIDRIDDVIASLRSDGAVVKIGERKNDAGVTEECWTTKCGECLENSICDAVRRVFAKLDQKGIEYQQKLLKNLTNVSLYRIMVPEDTDLNHYFEIMNVRGEQLEQSDIVKARLMGVLENDIKRKWFARIWNACRDMTGYVQMNFSNENEERDILFGRDWNEMQALPGEIQDGDVDRIEAEKGHRRSSTIQSAILDPNAMDEFDEQGKCGDRDENVRFRSVIYFHHFLLHVLRIYNKSMSGASLEAGPLNEKDLAGEFELSLPKDDAQRAIWAWGFVKCLLTCRWLFDRYIIKRDYLDDTDSGEWSVMTLRKTGEKSWQYEETEGQLDDNLRCRMIESCLRVTYTEHKTMRWITYLLDWMYGKHEQAEQAQDFALSAVADKCEEFAKAEVRKCLQEMKENSYRMGTKTPHLLFNYLDYLLWASDHRNGGEHGFAFEYRNSVEHWYPQHPTTLASWDTGVGEGGDMRLDRDGFGNLCLIHASENSRFSNLPPVSKATYSPEMNARGSLKYRAMVNEVGKLRLKSEMTANQGWQKKSFEHGKEMLDLLAARVGFNLELGQCGWPADGGGL